VSVPAAFEPGRSPARGERTTLRRWSVRHSQAMERLYAGFERVLLAARPALGRIGWVRAERSVATLERAVKAALFDCRMCGQCILSSTGMSCPMNCPKALRNGPCGGVRANGHCEVYPEMPCVWVKAWEGSRAMAAGDRILELQGPVDNRLKGRSSWLSVSRGEAKVTP
jgi:hypothetical protein